MTQDPRYLLGHSERELRRLDLQGALYRAPTERTLRAAGVGPEMRVLDIGCGSGDVSLLAGAVVGPAGSVLGIDRSEGAVEAARAKVRAGGADHVDFLVTELDAFEAPTPFDALVGRFVLMHQPEPASVLRAVSRTVRPGGAIVLLESWMEVLRSGGHSEPFSSLYDEIVQWKCDVVGGAGADLHAGGRLRTVFRSAGLPDPETRLEAVVAGGPDSPYYEYVEESVRSMLPEARRLGLEGFDETASGGSPTGCGPRSCRRPALCSPGPSSRRGPRARTPTRTLRRRARIRRPATRCTIQSRATGTVTTGQAAPASTPSVTPPATRPKPALFHVVDM